MPLGIVHLQLGLQLGPGAAEPAAPPPAASTARNFNGTSSDYLEAADSASLQTPSAAITVACWCRPTADTQNSYAMIVRKHASSGAAYSYAIRQNVAQHNRFQFGIAIGVTGYLSGTPLALVNGTWYFVVGRWASGGHVNIDIYNADGSLFSHAESAASPAGAIAYTASPLYAGNQGAGVYGLNADLAQLYIDNTSLSDADVQTLLAGTRPHAASAGSWLLGVASPDPDDSGNSNDFTVHGTTVVAGP